MLLTSLSTKFQVKLFYPDQLFKASAFPFENTARTFFELGSAQRIAILYKIPEEKCNLAKLSKDLGCTMPEILRSIIRLTSSGLVERI